MQKRKLGNSKDGPALAYRFEWFLGNRTTKEDNQVEEFRNGTQKKWLTAFRQRTR